MKSALLLIRIITLLRLFHETNAYMVGQFGSLSFSSSKKCDSISTSALFAKKKKGKKNKSQKKETGFAWANSFTLKPFESTSLRDLASTACATFEGRTGKPLTEELGRSSDVPKTLWNAPLACVIVGEGHGDGELDNAGSMIQYANIAALKTVGLQPDQFEQLLATKDPKSGEWEVSANVKKFIDLPSSMKGDKSYESGYKKKMVKGGEDAVDITIENAQRWILEKSAIIDGKFATETLGVAYTWSSWVEGDDTLSTPGSISDFEEQIKVQGAVIRELKEVQGLGNKDPEVSNAVQELLRLKALLEEVSSK